MYQMQDLFPATYAIFTVETDSCAVKTQVLKHNSSIIKIANMARDKAR